MIIGQLSPVPFKLLPSLLFEFDRKSRFGWTELKERSWMELVISKKLRMTLKALGRKYNETGKNPESFKIPFFFIFSRIKNTFL